MIKRLNTTAIVGLALVGLVVLAALISFVWLPFDPTATNPADRLQNPSGTHWFGTDKYGRDTFSAVLVGARITLMVGFIAVSIAAVIGTPLGIIAGMFPGKFSEVLLRASDVALAFPALLLAIMLTAVYGASTLTAMVAIGISTVPVYTRIAYSGTRQVMHFDFISAARLGGQSSLRIALRHVLPNISGMLLVQSSISFGIAVLAEAALSFLGLGTPPPTPSWGRMLQESQQFLGTHPLLAVFPGLAIALTVLGCNLLGDGLRDRLDSKLAAANTGGRRAGSPVRRVVRP